MASNDNHGSLPSTKADWEKEAKKLGVLSTDIHRLTKVTSASSIELEQFFVLRVLWRVHEVLPKLENNILDFHRGHDQDARGSHDGSSVLDRVRGYLNGYKSWLDYLENLESGDPSLRGVKDIGIFTLVQYYQSRVMTAKDANSENSTPKFEPISRRTRSGLPSLERRSPLETPSRIRQHTHEIDFDLELEDSDADESFQTLEHVTPASITLSIPAKDEQIVNTALVIFLNAITVLHPSFSKPSSNVEWTMKRIQITFGKWVARTDGYLRCGDRIKAILEVKPFVRRKDTDGIQKQESAQMAAWVRQNPNDGICIVRDGHSIERYVKSHHCDMEVWLIRLDAFCCHRTLPKSTLRSPNLKMPTGNISPMILLQARTTGCRS